MDFLQPSSGLSLRAQPNNSVVWQSTQPTGPYGLPDPMIDGQKRHTSSLQVNSHPLEYTEKHFHENQERNDFLALRKFQGLHAPMRLMVERQLAMKVQRLPGLQSSNIMSDILTDRLETIDLEDILNDPMNAEIVGQPHILMERRLGI